MPQKAITVGSRCENTIQQKQEKTIVLVKRKNTENEKGNYKSINRLTAGAIKSKKSTVAFSLHLRLELTTNRLGSKQ